MTTTKKKLHKSIAGTVMALLVGVPLFACGGKLPGGLSNPLGGAGACPDVTNVDAVEKFDFVANYGIKADGAAKLKSGAVAAINMKKISDKIEADLKAGCSGLSGDLGGASDFPSAVDACNAAISAMNTVKAKMGANAKIGLDITPPECRADVHAYADCAGHCDPSISPGSAKVECEPGKLSGTCSGQCSGTCEMKAAAKCGGTCSGTCDAKIKGTCSGKCDGKCDGKPSKGANCNGTCEGKCDAQVNGTCSGNCGGSCAASGSASCDGTCDGSCSVEMQAPSCTGKMTPPKMSADCTAKCDSDVGAKAECSPAGVALEIHGAADVGAATTFKLAVEKNFPAILKVAIGMVDTAPKLVSEVPTVITGVQGGITSIAASAGPAKGAMIAGSITSCFGGPFKGALDAATKVKANVDVSVSVKANVTANGASASASGSAGASAH
jgi:hypothetical protein